MPLENHIPTWYDTEIRFDLMTRYLKLCTGEKTFEVLDPVEDTKGNNGEPGKLVVTNLRLIWQSKKFPKINLSIGYNPITSINIKSVTSKLRGLTESLHILAKTKASRYEFIFTNLVIDNNRLFSVVLAVQKAYTQSRLYREIKMRSGIVVANKKLQMLQKEQICEQVNGVWNLSSDQGNLGSFFITNVRVVWYAASNELFNASIPFLQIAEIKIRDSKFGKALVIDTTESGGSYVLGFRIDPKEKLLSVYKSLMSIHETYMTYPEYGVEFNPDSIEAESEERKTRLAKGVVTFADEVEEIEDNPELVSDAFGAYFADGYRHENAADREKKVEIIFCEELGLAVEKPKDGFTMQQLWEVIPSN
ncbi:Bardet-Biedl syndrome 5 protein homolog [Folsomia candida]|uniref:Bardet-Biedl syndrome 5 protein n=1 Tax=Folsomia candida TaxID=158441 RepID=A0A226CX93_FOLCA|nr:Bardet-Biedl syndrome 5 protein homolog [Folsomia candida]OXA37942.1 Bardet-Biedl syndrome 5 protein [Folsomia candida]